MSHQLPATAGTDDGVPPVFSFSYRSIPFRVRLRETDAGVVGVLEAVIGIVPFTVDGDSLRSNMLAVIDKARRSAGYGIDVGANHAISLSVALPVDDMTPADKILAAAMEQLAGAKTFLDLVLLLQPPHLRKITGALSRNAA